MNGQETDVLWTSSYLVFDTNPSCLCMLQKGFENKVTECRYFVFATK